ncbi:MAG: hypothetical protein WC542_06905 [Paludibacter sp.]
MKTLKLYIQYWTIRMSSLIFFMLIVFGSYFFSVPRFRWGSIQLNNIYYRETEDLPGWLYGAEYFIFTFLVISILLIILVTFYKRNKRIRKKIRHKYEDYFASGLVSYLYSGQGKNDGDKNPEIEGFKTALKDDYAKRIFINTLRRIRTQTLGDVRDKTLTIYNTYKFDYLIRAYLHSPYLRKKLFALKVISDFQLEGYEHYIFKLIKHKNNVLHSEALVTLVKLKKLDNLQLLLHLKINLTIWDINVIIKTVLDLKRKDINCLTLMESNNTKVSVLGIMLARLNLRQDLKMNIRQKIGNADDLVNEEAYLAYVSFAGEENDFDFLIDKFELATEKAKISIIKALASNPNKTTSIQFLELIVKNETFILKLEALQVLLLLDLSAVVRFKRSENITIRNICSQVLDFNL